jgi:PIN domain
MLVYLDLCSIQRPLDDQTQLRIHLEAEAVLGFIAACEAGEEELISSDALEYEAGRNPNPVRHAYALGVLSKAARIVRLSPPVEAKAHELTQAGLKPLDALHLAFATEAGAAFFCTCDDRLLRRARTIQAGPPKIVSPLELITEINP